MKKNYLLVFITTFLLTFISVAYAAFNSELTISGSGIVEKDTTPPTCGTWYLRDSNLTIQEAYNQNKFTNPSTNTSWTTTNQKLFIECSDNMPGSYGCIDVTEITDSNNNPRYFKEVKEYTTSIKTDSEVITVKLKDAYLNEKTCTLPVGGSNPYIDKQAPVVTITPTAANKFTYSATDDLGVTGYQVTTSATQPTTWLTTPAEVTIDNTAAKTYYVWAKDGVNVSYQTINTYLLTRTQGTGTTLTLKYKNNSGTPITNSMYVLSGTPVYVTGSLSTGYNTLVLKKGSTTITSPSTQTISSATTISSSASPNTYTVSYDANGGSGTMASQVLIYNANTSLTTNTFTRNGYTFAGWNTKEDGTGTNYSDGQTKPNITSTNNGTVTLYAKWTVNQYTLTINPNSGIYNNTSSNTVVTQDYGTTYNVYNNATRDGYIFAGWKLTSGNGDIQYFLDGELLKQSLINSPTASKPSIYNNKGNGTVTHTIIEDETSSTGYSLQITTNGEASPSAGGFYNGVTATSGAIYYHKIVAKVPVGYKLNFASNTGGVGYGSYWLTGNSGTGNWETYIYIFYAGYNGPFSSFGHVYLSGSNNQDVTWYINECSMYRKGSNLSQVQESSIIFGFLESNATLTAQWSASGATVTWDKQGGTFGNGTIGTKWTATSSSYRYLTDYSAIKKAPYYIDDSTFTIYKTGYTFDGWYTSSTGGTQIFNASGQLNPSVSGYSDANRKWLKYDSNVTLYARWIPNTYTVTADANNGSIASTTGWTGTGESATKTVTYNSTYGTLPIVTRAGYTFDGWTTDYTGYKYSAIISTTVIRLSTETNYSSTTDYWQVGDILELDLDVVGTTITSVDLNDNDITPNCTITGGTNVKCKVVITSAMDVIHRDLYYHFVDINNSSIPTSYTVNKLTLTKSSITSSSINYIDTDHTITAKWVDDTPPTKPTVTLKFADNSGTYTSGTWTNKQVITQVSSTEEGSGITSIPYNFAGTWTTGSAVTKSGTTYSKTESWTVTDGRNVTVVFKAIDADGNESLESDSVNIKYDISGPTITASNITYGSDLSITLADPYSGVTGWQVTNSSTAPTSGWTTVTKTTSTTVTKSGLAAGTYYIWAKDDLGNTNSKQITVNRQGIAFPTCSDKAYTASEQTLFDAHTSGSYTNNAIKGTTVGGYTGALTPTSNYQWNSGSDVTAARILTCNIVKSNTTTTASNVSQTYSGSAITGSATAKLNSNNTNISGGAISYTYYNGSSCSGTALSSAPTNWRDGGYSYIASITGTDNYNTSTSTCATLVINKATNPMTFTTPQSGSVTYNTSSQNKTFTAASSAQGTVTYTITSQKDSGNTDVSYFTIPTNTTASMSVAANTPVGTYTIVIKASAAGGTNYNSKELETTYTLTVGKKKATIALTDSSKALTYPTAGTNTYTYGGTATPTCSSSNSTYVTCSVDATNHKITVTPVKPTSSAVTITVSATEASGSNYSNPDSKTFTVTVAKGTLTATVTALNGTYTGSAQYAKIKVTKSDWDGATIVSGTTTSYGQSVTTSGVYNTDYNLKPGYTNVQASTTIYYKITGGTYYNDLTGSTTAKINQKKATITRTDATKTLTYPTAGTNTYTYDGDGTLSCSSSDTTYVTCSVDTTNHVITVTPVKPTSSAVTITLSATAGTNYSAPDNKTFTVTVAKGTLTAIATALNGTYSGSAQYAKIKVTKSDWDGATIVSGTTTSYGQSVTTSGVYNTNYNLKPGYTNVTSSTTIYYKITGGTYYNDLIGSTTAAIGQKKATITLTDSSKALTYPTAGTNTYTYDGAATPTCTSSDSTYVTCSVDTTNHKITVTPVKPTSSAVTITVSATEASESNYSNPDSKTFTVTVAKGTCPSPSNVSITSAGVVTWTAATGASSYQISMSETSGYTAATSGVNYNSSITDSTGTRTVYVRSVCDTTYYSSANSTPANKSTTVYSLTLTKGTGINTVSGAGNYITGSSVGIDATLKTGYTWSNWTGSSTISTKSTSVNMNGNKSYTANATAKTYTIGYTLNGGSVSPANPTSYTIESSAITLTNPTKTGYTFTGWTGSNGTTPQTSVTIAAGSTGNKSYTANYSINNPATPTISGNGNRVYNYSSRTLTCSTTTTYASGTNIYYQFGYSETAAEYTAGTITWIDSASTTNTLTVQANEYLGTRYFGCRVYASDGTSTTSTITATTSGAMSFVNARLFFDVATNGGTRSGSANLYVPYGLTNIYTGRLNQTAGTIPTATKTGYTFTGWYTAASGGSKIIDASKVVQASVSGWTDVSKNWLRTDTSNQDTANVLFAQFTANTYTIAYAMNYGGNPNPKPTTGTYDSDVVIGSTTMPSKSITVTGNANNSGATVGSATVNSQTFTGWTSSTSAGLGSGAKTGTSATPSTAWTGTATTNKYFRNLRDTSGTVTLTANWSGNIKLPTLSKTNNICNWYASDASTEPIGASGESIPVASNSSTSITVYAKCVQAHYKIGNNYYVTLEDALNAASATGTTIVVIDDHTDTSTVSIDSSKITSVTLNTNGKTITRNGNQITVGSGVTLNIAGSGGISFTGDATGGKLINNGTITLASATLTKAAERVVENNGTFTMNSGTIKSTTSYQAVYNNTNGTFTINNGTIEINSNTFQYVRSIIENYGTLNVAGGTLDNIGTAGYGVKNYETGIVNMSGGSITAKNSSLVGISNMSGTATINISGGTINSEGIGLSNEETNGTGAINLTGGTVIANVGIMHRGGTVTVGSLVDTSVSSTVPSIQANIGISRWNGSSVVTFLNGEIISNSIDNIIVGDYVTRTGYYTKTVPSSSKYRTYLIPGLNVTFNTDGGSVSPSSITAMTGVEYGELPTPTKSGYLFNGWFLDYDGYTTLDYIETDGASYIDTGVAGNTIYGLDFRYTPLDNVSGYDSYLSTAVDNFTLGRYNNNAIAYIRHRGTEVTHALTVDNNGVNRLILKNGKAIQGNQSFDVTTTNPIATTNANLIVGNNSGLNRGSIIRIYGLTLYDSSGEIMKHYIPVSRQSDGKYGLYEVISGTFIAGSGSGSLYSGPASYITSDTICYALSDHTLEAEWTPAVTITFDAGPASVSPTSKVAVVNGAYGDLPTPTNIPAGYEFKGWSRVPSGYEELEYIESTGTQYINTGYSTTTGTVVEVGVSYSSTTGSTGYIVGAHATSSPYGRNGIDYKITDKKFELGIGESYPQASYNLVFNQKYDIKYSTLSKNSYLNINGSRLITSSSTVSTTSNNIYVFTSTYHLSNNLITKAKLYYLKIYDNAGTLIRDYIPVINTSTGKAGLYDIAHNTFYGNDGTGDFVAGPRYGSITSSTIIKNSNDHTLTAQYELTNYSITYNLNGGSVATPNPTSYNVTSPAITLTNPTKTGSVFNGWTGSNGSTAQTKVTIPTGSTGDKSYTANWTPTNYTLTARTTYGTINATSGWTKVSDTRYTKTLTYGAQYGTLPTATRSGYLLKGWFTSSSGGTQVTSSTTMAASNTTIYAQWTKVDSTSKTFSYTGAVQTYVAPSAGTYKLEVCGAQGGSPSVAGYTRAGGNGGCATGNVSLSAGQTLYVFVGGKGNTTTGNTGAAAGGWNGGGATGGTNTATYYGSGGGATHISKSNATIANAGNNLLIVGGGGGGGLLYYASDGTNTSLWFNGVGGAGGGSSGGTGVCHDERNGQCYGAAGTGGSQSGPGGGGASGSKGQGGTSGSGGGGGFYGGGGGNAAGAGGGSGYVGGVSSASWSSSSCQNSGTTRTGNGCAKITKQ